MRIGICVNHSWPHCGGSEKVIQQISESLVNKFSVDCHVFSKTTNSPFTHNGVDYHPVSLHAQKFIKDTQSFGIESMLVYSDYFYHWPTMISNPKKLGYKLALATVGLNASLDQPILLKKLKDNKEAVTVITHSDDYQDYQLCKIKGIDPVVIPNGVDLDEFKIDYGLFRKKYNLHNKKIILCVSNFFPGKGQEHLIPICQRLAIDDYCLVVICSSLDFKAASILEEQFKTLADNGKINYILLKDLDRTEVVSAFTDADAFAFATQKEVAPLVILESMASRTPWISLPVGNVKSLSGGVVISSSNKDIFGNYLYNDSIYDQYAQYLNKILTDNEFSKTLTDQGVSLINSNYNWNNIFQKYYDILK